jgi:hypothetical protein
VPHITARSSFSLIRQYMTFSKLLKDELHNDVQYEEGEVD